MLDSGMKIKQPWCCVLWSCRKGCSKLLQLQGKNWVSQAPGKDSGHLQYCTSLGSCKQQAPRETAPGQGSAFALLGVTLRFQRVQGFPLPEAVSSTSLTISFATARFWSTNSFGQLWRAALNSVLSLPTATHLWRRPALLATAPAEELSLNGSWSSCPSLAITHLFSLSQQLSRGLLS